jgi:hypothetical protein
MKRKRDNAPSAAHWHVDCRIEAELPDDSVVGRRFLVNVVFTALALGMMLFTGWIAYLNLSVRQQIRDWEQRISDNRSEVRDIQRMQREYGIETAKIDQAHALVRPQLFVSGLITNLGRTRPDQVVIDIIEWNDSGVVVRGSLRETSERASRLLRDYVEQLLKDDKIAPLFREIVLTDMQRGGAGDTMRFEINLRLKGTKA